MTALELYAEATRRGLRLEAVGDKLVVTPASRCPPDFAEKLRQQKAEILRWLNTPPCPGWKAVPPTNLPLMTTIGKQTPEKRERVIGYLQRQTGGTDCPLAAWLRDREAQYFAGPGRAWDCGTIAYAAARDAALWQLSRRGSTFWRGWQVLEMLDLLETFERVAQQERPERT